MVDRDKRIVILLSDKERKAYDQYCLDNDTTKTKDIRDYILSRIKPKKKDSEKPFIQTQSVIVPAPVLSEPQTCIVCKSRPATEGFKTCDSCGGRNRKGDEKK